MPQFIAKMGYSALFQKCKRQQPQIGIVHQISEAEPLIITDYRPLQL